MSISNKLIGLWEVYRGDHESLLVRKLDDNENPKSLWFMIYPEDPDLEEEVNRPWYDVTLGNSEFIAISRGELPDIQWPSYLEPKDTEIINVTSSGNFYVED